MSAQPTNHDPERLGEPNRLTEASRDQSTDRQLGEDGRETRRLGQRYTVQEAAEILGTSVDAVRGRIRRGTLDSLKVEGVVYVLLDAANRERHADQSTPNPDDGRQLTGDQSELVSEMRGQIDWLRREVERKDTIIMSLTQRIPELEAPPELRDAPETSSGGTDGVEVPPEVQEPAQHRSWLYRFFFGP
ncbi:MAG: helix-turn-helix domain-containing protein [Actinobacteria bacterium]|nr:helix-turn-helix domain-containing protein [Actinomycetota bacterium]